MNINSKILEIFSFFKQIEENEKIYLVGGAVRDIILGKEPKDLDFAFEGNAVLFCQKLSENENIRNFQILSIKFDSCSFFYKDYEISFNSCRKDIYEENKLKIERGTIYEDLRRRDFTINAVALSLGLKLIDPLNGLQDILDKRIRIISDESFVEDPSRLIRCVRYLYKLKFNFETITEKKFYESLKLLEKNVKNIRVIKELNRTLEEFGADILNYSFFKEILRHLSKSKE